MPPFLGCSLPGFPRDHASYFVAHDVSDERNRGPNPAAGRLGTLHGVPKLLQPACSPFVLQIHLLESGNLPVLLLGTVNAGENFLDGHLEMVRDDLPRCPAHAIVRGTA
jgi:hypothetical protein